MKNESRYLDGSYITAYPDYGEGDAEWKAGLIAEMLQKHGIVPTRVGEVGCGTGQVLRELLPYLPTSHMVGYDISPQAMSFWKEREQTTSPITFRLGDFHELASKDREKFDVLLMIDVFEHVRDPYTFLEDSRAFGRFFLLHIPLEPFGNDSASGRSASGSHIECWDTCISIPRILPWKYCAIQDFGLLIGGTLAPIRLLRGGENGVRCCREWLASSVGSPTTSIRTLLLG